ncbi:MAG TPA: hypothetical protein VF174_13195 [Micromonosporaceae bacterium]
MAGDARLLTGDAVWSLAEYLDVPAVLEAAAAEAASSAGSSAPTTPPGCTGGDLDTTVHCDPVTGERVRLPTAVLCALRAAGCAASAARRLLPANVLTVGVVGPAPVVWWHVAVLCRHIRTVTHVAVATDVSAAPIRLADQLDLAGVGLSITDTAPAAAFGANLVVAAGPAPITGDRIVAGALLVEAVPGAFPRALHARARVVLSADAKGLAMDGGGFTVVTAPIRTAHLDAALAAEIAAVDTRMALTQRE